MPSTRIADPGAKAYNELNNLLGEMRRMEKGVAHPKTFSIFKAQNGFVLTIRQLPQGSGELWNDIISDSLVYSDIDGLMSGIEMVVLGLYEKNDDSNQS